jgi:NNP family nitrate/nitrite transporter-like MFS transporter
MLEEQNYRRKSSLSVKQAGEFKCAVNPSNKATELPLLRLGGTVQQNPHMRAFWGATTSFFIAFVGWFALAPVELDVMHSMGICENQLYVVGEDLTRPAFVQYVNIHTGKGYCVHGKLDDRSDCKAIPEDDADIPVCAEDPQSEECTFAKTNQYDFETLKEVKCICGKGSACKNTAANGAIASVASAVFVRIALGYGLEVLGPVNVQCGLLTFSGAMVALSAAIFAPWNYVTIRFLIGCAGATFVTNQFWCSLMFAPNIIGMVNATAAGWGNLGGGVTQIFVVWCLVIPFRSFLGMSDDLSWRMAMLGPALLFFMVAATVKYCCWDMPEKKRFDPSSYKTTKTGCADYLVCLKDAQVMIMVGQYSACFGAELAMNNQLATHFRVYFQMPAGEAALLAGSFGMMNLFARSLGGIMSDMMFARFGFRGRIWSQFGSLMLEGLTFFGFACVSNEYPWYYALIALCTFSLFVQMAQGTSYAMVPFMKPEQLAIVSALVGAGGNAGAVFAGFAFYKQDWENPLTPFQLHAIYVIFWGILSVFYSWPEHGSMFSPPTINSEEMNGAQKLKKPPRSESQQTLTREFNGNLDIGFGDASPSSSKPQDSTPSTKAPNDLTPYTNKNIISSVPELARV